MEDLPKLNRPLTLKERIEAAQEAAKKANMAEPILTQPKPKAKPKSRALSEYGHLKYGSRSTDSKAVEPAPEDNKAKVQDEPPVLNEEPEEELTPVDPNEPNIDEMLVENQRRIDELRLVGIDQKTGEGMPGHTEILELPDYQIKKQWLTPETMDNNIYKKVKALGSVGAYAEYFNATHAKELGDSQITTEDVVRQMILIRMETDPAFAFITCFEIKDKETGRTVPYRLNYAQIVLLKELEDMRHEGIPIRLILLKARQWGGSTLVQLYMAWVQLFLKEGWNSVIIAQTKDTARRIKAMYTRMLSNFSGADIIFGASKLQFSPHEKSTADSVVTDTNGGLIRDNVVTIASFENYEATRGADFAMAHFSEVAYWVNTPGKTAEGLITNIAGGMLMAPMTLEVMESTANGMSGYFYDEYQMAKNPEVTSSRRALFIPFFYILNDTLPFDSDEERRAFAENLIKHRYSEVDTPTTESGSYLYSLWRKGASLEGIHWYVMKRASFHDHASMASEAPSDDVECFKHSGRVIFDQYLIDKYTREYVRQPEYKGEVMQLEGHLPTLTARDEKGLLWVWQYADNTPTTDRYLVVVDVGGRGKTSDFSVITVVDRWPLRFGGKAEVVARWRGHIRYDFLAVKAVMLARMYCNALLVFESNTFDKKKAESTEFTENDDHTRGILATIEDDYDNLYMRTSTSPEDIRQGRFRKIGFQTNRKTKQDMVDHFIVTFEDNIRFLDPDWRVYAEMSIYEQREDGSYGNLVGRDNHDDILMTDMIADLISDSLPLPAVARPVATQEWVKGTVNESML